MFKFAKKAFNFYCDYLLSFAKWPMRLRKLCVLTLPISFPIWMGLIAFGGLLLYPLFAVALICEGVSCMWSE